MDGNELKWQDWTVRLGFNYREGPVLYQLAFDDNGTKREVAYRLSLAEMVVPYRDPAPTHYRRTAYDIGEWGLGYMTTSLELGCDCLGVRSSTSTPRCRIPRASPTRCATRSVCTGRQRGDVEARRPPDRCRGSTPAADGDLLPRHRGQLRVPGLLAALPGRQHRMRDPRTGIMVTTPFPEGEQGPPYGTVVDVDTYARSTSTSLVARLDLDVDGDGNAVMEVDSMELPVSPDNPHGLAVVNKSTPIVSEAESARDFDWSTQRSWKVVNPNKTNAFGTPVSYKLVPGACFPSMMDPATTQYLRAPVIGHTLWVTKNSPDERWPAGPYPTRSETDAGMTEWIKDDASLVDTDVVLCCVFGIHHITRVEEWPIMSVDVVSFWLKPSGVLRPQPLNAPPTVKAQGGACTTE